MNKYLFLPLSLLVFVGCATKDQKQIEQEAVNNIIQYKDSVKKDKKILSELGIKQETTLVGVYGPSSLLSLSELKLAIYNNETLLFSGYGVKDNIYYLTTESLSTQEKDRRARNYGFKDLNHMFSYYFSYFKNKDISEIKSFLDDLEKKEFIKIENLSRENINSKTTEIFEKTISIYGEEDKNKYGIWIDNKFIKITKNDYIPYGFILTFMEELLDNKKGTIIYGL